MALANSLTALLGLIQGPILVPWYMGTIDELPPLLVNGLFNIKLLQFVGDAAGHRFIDDFNPVYAISQIQSSLDWTSLNVENMASLDNLYRRTRRYSDGEPWQHWMYLSAQMEPWKNSPTHEALGRPNFHYMSCHKTFLCASRRVNAPALLHFSINATATTEHPEFPYHEPVSVRVFELPLQETIIPGANLTFWTTKDTYSHFVQSYGLLAKAEDKRTTLWIMQDTTLITGAYLISFVFLAFPTYLFKHVRAMFVDTKEPETSGTELKSKNPLAQALEEFLGGRVLRKIEAELSMDDWNTPEEIIQEFNGALGLDENRQLKGR
ncbi:uncharacterized protein FOBCDRAFT_240648 [Fusarium oxysporum Fo47]|uniref:uncharacterized protein n=1 Tax=Fusarium oxysporum Fo47 TaxID=660027 RepID=UPI002869C981|nr:uncharacterized protein FOBCDRAFT_240648 [Fusarium oxysporum Fo47]WJG35469.1 hypothetical protein FOBCDRAFT_240648 [Fusarium oxysporum Fo47]